MKKGNLKLPHSLSGVSRRDFLKYCSSMAIYMGLPVTMGPRIAEAAAQPTRPPVIWLSGQECTGCGETLLRSTHPSLDNLLLNAISLDYYETLSTPSGHLAEEAKEESIRKNKGKFFLVVDGSIPVKDGGIYCMVAGKTFLDIVKETAPQSAAVIAIGSCASWGGIASAYPNPTGATPVREVLKRSGIPVINIPGCPPNPYNFLSTVLYYLTLNKLPELDSQLRPKFAYGRLIHENCERRSHFDAGKFANQFGDEDHRQGHCLYKLGCKGPETFNNCPTMPYGDAASGSWPVATGHPCFGCSEKGVGFTAPLHAQAKLHRFTPPTAFPSVDTKRGEGITPGAAALVSAVAGAALGAGAVIAKNLGEKEKDDG